MSNDLIGIKFGKLIPIEKIVTPKYVKYKCKCDCGNESVTYGFSLKSGKTKSCGCYSRDIKGYTNFIHGHSKSIEYDAWISMKQRCYNKNFNGYHRYGGRGIKVCDRWLNSFENFLADMGKRPNGDYSLDRYPNNDGDYEPENCRWATNDQQQQNKIYNNQYTT